VHVRAAGGAGRVRSRVRAALRFGPAAAGRVTSPASFSLARAAGADFSLPRVARDRFSPPRVSRRPSRRAARAAAPASCARRPTRQAARAAPHAKPRPPHPLIRARRPAVSSSPVRPPSRARHPTRGRSCDACRTQEVFLSWERSGSTPGGPAPWRRLQEPSSTTRPDLSDRRSIESARRNSGDRPESRKASDSPSPSRPEAGPTQSRPDPTRPDPSPGPSPSPGQTHGVRKATQRT
jgi:hypothetical protein